MIRYRTVAKEAKAELVIERSRFIAHIAHVRSKDEADAFVKTIKNEYRDATHNVPAFVIGEKGELQWASDDGEPQGTSGPPMLQMLVREGLTNVVCVVTRYFGGIKLGTGGLVRAYTSAARAALEAAGIHEVKDVHIIRAELPYNALGKLQNMEKNEPFTIENITYTDKVAVDISMDPLYTSKVTSLLADLTGGSALILEEEDKII